MKRWQLTEEMEGQTHWGMWQVTNCYRYCSRLWKKQWKTRLKNQNARGTETAAGRVIEGEIDAGEQGQPQAVSVGAGRGCKEATGRAVEKSSKELARWRRALPPTLVQQRVADQHGHTRPRSAAYVQ